jgi:hypothetical protein
MVIKPKQTTNVHAQDYLEVLIEYCKPYNQLLAHGRLFSPGTPASSTTKSGRHDIAEILLKVALKRKPPTCYKSLANFIT